MSHASPPRAAAEAFDAASAYLFASDPAPPAVRIRPSQADFRQPLHSAGVDERSRLMHRIAWLDAALAAGATTLTGSQRRAALCTCVDILYSADADDRAVIAQAIHCLMRKHGLPPEVSGAN